MTTISIPNTFTPLTTISSSQMNANFTAIAAAFGQSLGIDAAETLTGALKAADGAAAAPSYTFGSDTNTGFYKKATDSIGIVVGGVEHGYVDASGNWFIPTGALTLANTALHLLDTNASHDLIIAPGSNLTADRTLTITTGDASRTLTISGDATVTGAPIDQGKHTIWIPAGAMITRTTNGAASGTAEMTTNKNMFRTLDFDQTTQEFAQFEVFFPKSWNLGTVTFQPVLSHASGTGNVVFGLAGVARSDDDAGDVAFGTAQTSDKTVGTANDIYIGPESSAITIAGTPAAGDTVQFQINRTVASDNLNADARLHGIKLFYTINAPTDA